MLFSGFRVCKMNIRLCKLSYTSAYSSIIVVWQKKKKKKNVNEGVTRAGIDSSPKHVLNQQTSED